MMTLKEIKPTDPDYHKPIEELIEDLGHAEPANQHGDVIITVEDLTDALHYLQTYQRIEDEYEELKDWWAEEYVTNEPLTWDELKQIKGKPVWVEDNIDTPEDITKYWAIMWRIEKAEGDDYVLLSDFYYQKSEYGKSWIAYRKERQNVQS